MENFSSTPTPTPTPNTPFLGGAWMGTWRRAGSGARGNQNLIRIFNLPTGHRRESYVGFLGPIETTVTHFADERSLGCVGSTECRMCASADPSIRALHELGYAPAITWGPARRIIIALPGITAHSIATARADQLWYVGWTLKMYRESERRAASIQWREHRQMSEPPPAFAVTPIVDAILFGRRCKPLLDEPPIHVALDTTVTPAERAWTGSGLPVDPQPDPREQRAALEKFIRQTERERRA
jgi:hypothetical protein